MQKSKWEGEHCAFIHRTDWTSTFSETASTHESSYPLSSLMASLLQDSSTHPLSSRSHSFSLSSYRPPIPSLLMNLSHPHPLRFYSSIISPHGPRTDTVPHPLPSRFSDTLTPHDNPPLSSLLLFVSRSSATKSHHISSQLSTVCSLHSFFPFPSASLHRRVPEIHTQLYVFDRP